MIVAGQSSSGEVVVLPDIGRYDGVETPMQETAHLEDAHSLLQGSRLEEKADIAISIDTLGTQGFEFTIVTSYKD